MSDDGARRFFSLVAKMRDYQKKYVKTRSSKELYGSKKYEEMVDDIISKTKERIKETESKQQQKLNV